MRALAYDRFGGVEVMGLRDLPMPSPAPGRVVVAVRASSLNVLDSRVRQGAMGPLVRKTFPKIPGADFAGVVAAVGSEVKDLLEGDEVFGAADPFKGGALAEFVAVPAGQVARKPPKLAFEAAAALPIAGLAALISLRDLGRAERGDSVLIHGASGGVGLFAVQIGRHLGARVTAVTGTRGVEAVHAFGAERVIDYQRSGAEAYDQTFEAILNASGRLPFARGRRLLTADGRLIEPSPTIPIFIGSKLGNLLRRQKHLVLQTFPRRADLEVLAQMWSDGVLEPTLAKVAPLDEAKAMFALMEAGGVVGKLVIAL